MAGRRVIPVSAQVPGTVPKRSDTATAGHVPGGVVIEPNGAARIEPLAQIRDAVAGRRHPFTGRRRIGWETSGPNVVVVNLGVIETDRDQAGDRNHYAEDALQRFGWRGGPMTVAGSILVCRYDPDSGSVVDLPGKVETALLRYVRSLRHDAGARIVEQRIESGAPVVGIPAGYTVPAMPDLPPLSEDVSERPARYR